MGPDKGVTRETQRPKTRRGIHACSRRGLEEKEDAISAGPGLSGGTDWGGRKRKNGAPVRTAESLANRQGGNHTKKSQSPLLNDAQRDCGEALRKTIETPPIKRGKRSGAGREKKRDLAENALSGAQRDPEKRGERKLRRRKDRHRGHN